MMGAARRIAALALALGLLAGTAPAAQGAGGHVLLSAITAEDIGVAERLRGACGVAVGAGGEVYLADYFGNRVLVFDQAEELLTKVGGISPFDSGGVAPLGGPCDLTVDSAGRLYVNEYHRAVVRLDPSSDPPGEATSYSQPVTIDPGPATGIAVDRESDRLYVNRRDHIAVYEPSGAPVPGAEGELRIGLGSLADSYGVAISDFPPTAGRVYAADAATETVKVYDPALDPNLPRQEIRGEGTAQGGFRLTDTDLVVDPADGHLYVAENLEPGFHADPEAVVDEFSPAGLYRGSVPPSFLNGFPSFLTAAEPSSLAIAKGGGMYVTSGRGEGAAAFLFGPPDPAETRLLTVAATGSGHGRVTSLPAAIACEPVCVGEFDLDSTVVLRAEPERGSVLLAWNGCDEEPSPGRCAVALDADRTVEVEFGSEGTAAKGRGEASGGDAPAEGVRSRPASPPSAGAPVAGSSAIAQRGALRVAFDGRISPQRLPRRGFAPVAVTVGGRISTVGGSELPQLRRLLIEFNRGGRMQSRGLPVCSAGRVRIASSARALSLCRRALVGRGRFEANVVLRGQEPYPTAGRLLIFNGRREGRQILLGHIYTDRPFASSFVIVFDVSRRKRGRFGTVLSASLPEALGSWGYVTGIEMKLGRRYAAGAGRRSFLSASCPAPKGFPGAIFTLARAQFEFAGAKRIGTSLTRSCKVR